MKSFAGKNPANAEVNQTNKEKVEKPGQLVVDKRQIDTQLKKMQKMVNNSLQIKQLQAIQELADNSRQVQQVAQTAPIQLRAGTLNVDTAQHGDAVDQVPNDQKYNVGFVMDVSLNISQPFQYNFFLENFELTQYVRDEYEFWDEEQSVDSQALGEWARDSYGQDEDPGDWNSDGDSTTWQDTPGWVEGTNIETGYLLNEYAVEFYFTIGDANGGILYTSDEIRLLADSDNEGNLDYTTPDINDAIDYDPQMEEEEME